MNPVELLSRWSDLCEKHGIKWVLYGETLLCAHGYYRFPAALTEVQVAVEACDMPRVAGEILPEMENVEKVNVYSLTEMPAMLSTLTCNEEAYPVLPDYKKYLAETYGDYEAGLFDPIGVGLTVEEKAELKAHQKKCLEALTFLESLRKEHGIRYYLLAGSVLGAVRHKGFIPWDDDIDVGIRKEDLARVEALVKEFLPAGFTLEQTAPNHPYPRMFSKICYNGRCCIDLWPLIPSYQHDSPKGKFLWNFGKLFYRVHLYKNNCHFRGYEPLVKTLGSVMSDKTALALARKNENHYLKKDTPYYVNLYSVYTREKESIRREWLEEEAYGEFCGLTVPIVGCTQDYLTHLYGDYTTLPAPWKRASRHSARFNTAEPRE